ncbi:hypothetical protein BT93_H1891 [Corymbia citriodora subsp. variegata]|nr:hypothetical protein BT93_H1891 [Corymbia citriodora subsp. variegata]
MATYDPEEDSEEDDNDDDTAEIAVAKMTLDKPYVCQALKPAGAKESVMLKAKDTQIYTFDVTKLDEIFDQLMRDGVISCQEGETTRRESPSQKQKGEGIERKEVKVKSKFESAKSSSDSSASSNMVQVRLPPEFKASAMRVIPMEEETFEFVEAVKAEFQFTDEEVAEFKKLLNDKTKYLKALMVIGKIEGRPINRILVDAGATLNLMPYQYFRKIGKDEEGIIPTNVTLSDFTGDVCDAKRAMIVDLTIGSHTTRPTL